MRKQTYDISQFLCPDCGKTIPLPRRTRRERKSGHIKDIYCPFCNKVQKTIEYKRNEPIKNGLGEFL